MDHPNTSRHPTALVARTLARPLEAALVVIGVLAIAWATPLWFLLAWVIAAGIYIGISVRRLHRASRDTELNAIHLPADGRQHGTWSKAIHLDVGIIALASLVGIVGAFTVLFNARASDYSALSRVVAALAIVFAWVLLQLGFSRLYADSWFYTDHESGFAFPGTERPGIVEFAYFTFSIGATLQTSDTSVTSTHMRWLVTVHASICFVYNLVLLSFAVKLIFGG